MDLESLQTNVEAISRLYAGRNGIDRTDDWFVLKLAEEIGELTQTYLALSGRARDKSLDHDALQRALADELADVLGHTLLIAEHFDIDLAEAMQRKWLGWLPTGEQTTLRGAEGLGSSR